MEGKWFCFEYRIEYYRGKSYYERKKEKNKHIGTIITGTVFDGGNS